MVVPEIEDYEEFDEFDDEDLSDLIDEVDQAPGGVRHCAQCNVEMSWGTTSWCPACGYYPRLGTQVEVDAEMVEVVDAAPDSPWAMLPPWSRTLLAVGVAALVEIVAVAILLGETPYRPAVGALHVLVGLLLMSVAHVRAYFYAVMADDKVGLADLFVNPLQVWRPVMRALPRTNAMLCAVCAGSILLLGGLTMISSDAYRIFEIGPRRRKKAVAMNPGAALARAAKPDEDVEDLDEAMTEFAETRPLSDDTAAADDQPSGDDNQEARSPRRSDSGKKTAEKSETDAAAATDESNRKENRLDCVVFGYQPASDGSVASLLLAANPEGTGFRYVGLVSWSELSSSERTLLEAFVRRSPSSSAAVKCSLDAFWVEPTSHCEITFESWSSDGQMVDPQWQGLTDHASP